VAKGFLRHAPGGPEAINDASFADDISDPEQTYIIEFWSAGCAACERIAGELSVVFGSTLRVTIYTANVDEEPELASRCRVLALPAVLVFRCGAEVFRSHNPDAPRIVAAFITGNAALR
jgi:thioredoxin 1